MLLENMVPWHIKYFRMKEFEKMTEARKVIKLSCETCSPHMRRKAHPSFWRQRDTEKSKESGLAKVPPAYFSNLILFDPPYFSTNVHSSSNLLKIVL